MGYELATNDYASFALATSSMGTIARITRSSMMDVLDQDYIRTSEAKGVSDRRVIFQHALRML